MNVAEHAPEWQLHNCYRPNVDDASCRSVSGILCGRSSPSGAPRKCAGDSHVAKCSRLFITVDGLTQAVRCGLWIVIGTDSVERYFAARAGHRGIKAARAQYDAWRAIAERARWKRPEDIKKAHPKASILKSGRVVFNIKGNDYRLIVLVQYAYGVPDDPFLWIAR